MNGRKHSRFLVRLVMPALAALSACFPASAETTGRHGAKDEKWWIPHVARMRKAAPQPGDMHVWLGVRRTGSKPDGWKPTYRERRWGSENVLNFERRGGMNLVQINNRIADPAFYEPLLNPDGTLRRTPPPGYEYCGDCEWNTDMELPAERHFQRMHFNNPGLAVRMGSGRISFPLVMDYDGDGLPDVLISCENRRTWSTLLFRNPGPTGEAMPVFEKGVWVDSAGGNTAVSRRIDGTEVVTTRSTIVEDFRRTGYRGEKNIGLPDFAPGKRINENTWRYCDYNGDGVQDFLVTADIFSCAWADAYDSGGAWTGGVNSAHVWIYLGKGNGRYERPFAVPGPDGRPLETGCQGMLEDFDGDGDLDIIGNHDLRYRSFAYCRNVGTRTKPLYEAPRYLVADDGNELMVDCTKMTPSAYDWNGDGWMDIITGDESGGCAFIENTGRVRDGMPVFKQPVYFLQQADELKVEAMPSIAATDWDGDGDQDFLCGTAAGYVEFVENLSGPGVEHPKWARPRRLSADGKLINIRAGESGSIQGPRESCWGYLCISAADWDGDGLVDVMLGSITGQIVWFRNTGTKTSPKLSGPYDVEAEWDGPQPELAWGWMKPGKMKNPKAILTQWRTTPVMCDLNGDGLMDLILMDTEGLLCFWERFRRADGSLALKPPQRVLINADRGTPIRLNADLKSHRTGRRRLAVGDWDGDGRLDIFVATSNAALWRQEKHENGKWYFRPMGVLTKDYFQWHEASVAVVDFNADGIDDVVVTGEDGFFNYLRNPRSEMLVKARASWSQKPKPPRRNILENPGFEFADGDGGPAAWKTEGGAGDNPWRLERNSGMNGGMGVVWESADKENCTFLVQTHPAKPGHRYVADVKIRSCGVKGQEGAMLSLAWYDAGGRKLGQANIHDSGCKAATESFIRKEVKTPFLPSETKTMKIMLYSMVGASGKAVFDDATLCEDVVAPVDVLVSDVYRDSAATGDVKFSAGLDLPGAHLKRENVRGEFDIALPDGSKRRYVAQRLADDRATLQIPVSALGVGENKVTFTLGDGKTGKSLGEASMAFTRTENDVVRRVAFDRKGRMLLEGKPFFPCGVSMLVRYVTEAGIAKCAEGPFNYIMVYDPMGREKLDMIHRHGLMVSYEMRHAIPGFKDGPAWVKTDSDSYRWLEERVKAVAGHPAIMNWETNDEMDLSKLPDLVKVRKMLELLDPDHPCRTCIYQVDNVRSYLGSFETIGSDPYPIDEAPISLVADWTRKTVAGTLNSRHVTQVLQAFDWAYYRKRGGGSTRGCRFPTREEIVNMSYQAIAAGANGLQYYCFHDIFDRGPVVADCEKWDIVKSAVGEVMAHVGTYLADGDAPEVTGQTRTVVARAFGEGDAVRLLVVNASREAQTAELRVGTFPVCVPLKPLESKWVCYGENAP